MMSGSEVRSPVTELREPEEVALEIGSAVAESLEGVLWSAGPHAPEWLVSIHPYVSNPGAPAEIVRWHIYAETGSRYAETEFYEGDLAEMADIAIPQIALAIERSISGSRTKEKVA